jgi:hypothetical protein
MPTISVQVSVAMHEALKMQAKRTSTKGARITISDVVIGALRNAGFESDEVLEALARGECPEIDIRRRTAAAQRDPIERVQEYLISRGCQTPYALHRNLHMTVNEVNRGVVDAIEKGKAAYKPFDRPPIVHWLGTCKCKTALPMELPRGDRR